MSYGLRCWDENGKLILDISDRISKRLGRVEIVVNIPARTSLANLSFKKTVSLPSDYTGSGLDFWVHPTELMQLDWINNPITGYNISSKVVGGYFEISLDIQGGFGAFAINTKIDVEYGVY